MGDKGDKNAARPPEGSLVETRCLIKGPKSAIVPFAEPRLETRVARVMVVYVYVCVCVCV